MLPEGLEQALRNHNQSKEFDELSTAHKDLVSRIETSRRTAAPGDYYGDPERVKANVFVYRQVLLHRAIFLFEGALRAAVDENLYSMVLNIRGHFETTASMGYLCRRLQSLKNGDIPTETVDRNLCAQLLGTHQGRFQAAHKPINILSAFEHADIAFNISVLGGTPRQNDMLKNCYEYLCEFCHPNFHSNSVALDLDKSVPEFRFRHGQPMREDEFNLIGYLLISAPAFVHLYDLIPEFLPSGSP
jgi:hypothetical protein